jgi:sulfide:quinone oxidoreductase
MSKEEVVFPLEPVYVKHHIDFRQAKAVALRPEGTDADPSPTVEVEYTGQGRQGHTEHITYDYLINATGPRLNFAATPGLGPDGGHTVSVCTADHATEAARELAAVIEKMKAGERQTLVVGMGHGTCTCEGAAFEYAFNVDHELRQAGVRDLADLVYLTNENELGDFGVGGMVFAERGFETTSELWTASLFRERQIRAIVGAHVEKVEPGKVSYRQLDGTVNLLEFDFAMLLPPFTGVGLQVFNRAGDEITDTMFQPNKFMRVDADYTPKPFEEWKPEDWPETYESPLYSNVFAVGIAFAPPHPISRPRKTEEGVVIAPSPPRTGMPSGVMGKTVALTIVDRIKHGASAPAHKASMAAMGAACVASTGAGLRSGSAAAMTMQPIVPDYERYPTGRDLASTKGEIGLAGHWMKFMLHHLFLYKAKAKPGWFFIPE